jgi:hypothetical protein
MNVLEFSFINVDSTEVNDTVLSIKSNAAGVDEIPMSSVRVLLIFIIIYLLVQSFPSGRSQ